MGDIAKELRERSLQAEQEGEPLALLDEAADEIERLRLTDKEREAIRWFTEYGDLQSEARRAEVLAALLKRLG
jgi:hypothetical protein